MNTFLNGLKEATNIDYTENGGTTRISTMSDLYDMFALGGAYRTRSDEDCIVLFKKAYKENSVYALKCLFYLRDVREGQGERRFFRVEFQENIYLINKVISILKRRILRKLRDNFVLLKDVLKI